MIVVGESHYDDMSSDEAFEALSDIDSLLWGESEPGNSEQRYQAIAAALDAVGTYHGEVERLTAEVERQRARAELMAVYVLEERGYLVRPRCPLDDEARAILAERDARMKAIPTTTLEST